MGRPRRDWWASSEFALFVPHLKAVAALDMRAGLHARIELASATPWALTQQALAYKAPCVACGRLVPVFRARRSAAKRGHGAGNIYLGVSCPLAENVGCARGRAASAAYDALEGLIAAAQKPTTTLQGELL